ncbi:MAG: hypothetical protein IJ060_01680 [Oscillospiraceae bacterium]|nr:hypothetical protein [Oscillospiraceae bacterium]
MKRKICSVLTAAVCLACTGLSTVSALPAHAAGRDLYVGYAGKSDNYSTVNAAVSAAAALNPQSENDRVTIHIAPGTYREQITFNTPYLSFVNDNPSQQVILTWYYGIGYQYYSVDSSGVYNASSAAAKTEKHEPTQRWGCSVRVRSGAKYFRAENITFENSFNRYVTDEEIADGVSVSGSQSITFNRVKGADVQSKAATERAAAIAIEGNYSEFRNCTFQSSQDTLFLGSDYGYFRDCLIEGNTDYIFGSGTYVFDTCELRFKGYSASAAGGYITANKDAGRTLFTNCSVTAASGLTVNAGYFGRPWGASADVAFVNTKLQYEGIINSAGWTKMSNNAPENAKFKEYGTTANGKAVSTSGRVKGTVQSSANGLDTKTYLGSWTPFYLNGGTAVVIEPISGNLIRELLPAQAGYAWELRENAAVGSLIYTDREFVFNALPDALAGGEQIVTPCDGKTLSGTLAECKAGTDLELYVLLDNRVENLPGWMSGFEKTAPEAVSSNDVTYVIYRRAYSAGEQITLGANGQSSNCVNYAAIAVEPRPAATLPGDVSCDGKLNAEDLTILKHQLSGVSRLSGTALANADLNGDGAADRTDLQRLYDFLVCNTAAF